MTWTRGQNASAGNRTRVTSMATMYSTTRPLMLLIARQPLASMLAPKGHADCISRESNPGHIDGNDVFCH